jgi:hypothetical protein
VKISEIPKDSKVYLKIQNKTGGAHISSIHLFPDCLSMTRSSDASTQRLVLDPNQLDDQNVFASPLLQGLRICEICRRRLEKQVLQGGAR